MCPTPRHIILIGPMGVGKTTIGARLASELGCAFADSDTRIEATHGRTGAEIAAAEGVDRLHQIEMATFETLLTAPTTTIIAPAESVVNQSRGRELLGMHVTIWLDADASTLERRRSASDHRRPIDVEEASERRRSRRVHLEACCRARIDTSKTSPEETIRAIRASIDDVPT